MKKFVKPHLSYLKIMYMTEGFRRVAQQNLDHPCACGRNAGDGFVVSQTSFFAPRTPNIVETPVLLGSLGVSRIA
jgi:hypothetical protein